MRAPAPHVAQSNSWYRIHTQNDSVRLIYQWPGLVRLSGAPVDATSSKHVFGGMERPNAGPLQHDKISVSSFLHYSHRDEWPPLDARLPLMSNFLMDCIKNFFVVCFSFRKEMHPAQINKINIKFGTRMETKRANVK